MAGSHDEGEMGVWLSGTLVVALGFLGLSFVCAVAEGAFFTLSRWRLRQMAEDDKPSGRRVAELLKDPQGLLATLVWWNTVSYAGVVMAAMGLVDQGGWPAGWTVAGAVLALFGVGEIIPKTLAVRAPEYWARKVSAVVGGLHRAARPARWLAEELNARLLRWVVPASWSRPKGVTDEEYAELVDLARQEGMLGESQMEIILQIVGLDRRMARDVMRPRAQMLMIESRTPRREMIRLARQIRHTRIPLRGESPDDIEGILNTRRLLLQPEGDFADSVELPAYVPESMNLLRLLKALQNQRRGMAIVLDEYGSVAGLVTIEDILAPMLGPKASESMARGISCRELGDRCWRVSGAMRIDDFRRRCPELAPRREVDTLGGLVAALLGRIPAAGESVLHGRVRLTVLEADERRVRELEVRVMDRKEVAGR